MEATLRDIDEQLLLRASKELVRLVIIGSVDDGKSTLIGRLLYETGAFYDDQIAQVRRATRNGDAVDFSLFTDGLLAEREQGITIDVAYRFFETERRKFILADTPGHAQYTRNMATGASTADAAIILLDARLGVLPQTRRHAAIAALLGIHRLAVAVNKMDLVGFEESVFRAVSADLRRFADPLGFEELRFFPVSARLGDNVATSSARTPWHQGGTILHFLESVGGEREEAKAHFRFPVQLVVRPHLDYRGLAGQIATGSVSVGDEVTVLPSGARTTISAIDSFEGPLARATAPMSVVLRLADEVDASRGDLLAHPATAPVPRDRIEATAVWLSERPLDPARAVLLKHTTRTVPARVAVRSLLDLETLAEAPAAGLALNDIGRIVVTCARPVICDPYAQNRATGAFILIDALTNETVAAGIIGSAAEAQPTLPREPTMLIVQASDEASALRRAHEIEKFVSARGHLAAVVRQPGAALACAAAGIVAMCAVPAGDGAVRAALLGCGAQTLEVGEDWVRVLDSALGPRPRR